MKPSFSGPATACDDQRAVRWQVPRRVRPGGGTGSVVPLEADAGLVGALAGDLAFHGDLGRELDLDAGGGRLRNGALLDSPIALGGGATGRASWRATVDTDG